VVNFSFIDTAQTKKLNKLEIKLKQSNYFIFINK
jgi:hypothetical protein